MTLDVSEKDGTETGKFRGHEAQGLLQFLGKAHPVVLDDAVETLGDFEGDSQQGLLQQVPLAGEVLVEGFFAHSQLVSNLIHGDLGEPLAEELPTSGLEDAMAGFG
jgi:hypothetical protein